MQESRRRKAGLGSGSSKSGDTLEDEQPGRNIEIRSRNFAARFGIAAVVILCMVVWQLYAGPTSKSANAWKLYGKLQEGHWNFGDGRRTQVDSIFLEPSNAMLYYINVMLGNGGWVRERHS